MADLAFVSASVFAAALRARFSRSRSRMQTWQVGSGLLAAGALYQTFRTLWHFGHFRHFRPFGSSIQGIGPSFGSGLRSH